MSHTSSATLRPSKLICHWLAVVPYCEGEDGLAIRTVKRRQNFSPMIDVQRDLSDLQGRQSRESTAPLSDVENEGTYETLAGKDYN